MGGTATSSSIEGESSFEGEPMVGEKVCVTRKENAFADNSNDKWTVLDETTDENGNISLSFDKPGVYYVSSTPQYETYEMESGNSCVAPPIAVINVTGEEETEEVIDYEGGIIKDVTFSGGITKDSPNFDLNQGQILVPDYAKNLYAKLVTLDGAPSRCQITGEYEGHLVNLSTGDYGTKLPNLIVPGGQGAQLTIKALCENENVSDINEELTYSIKRVATLQELKLEGLEDFTPDNNQYEISVMEDVSEINIDAKPFLSNGTVKVNGEELSSGTIDIGGKNRIDVEVGADGCQSSHYSIDINWKQYGKQDFIATPGSVLSVKDRAGNLIETLACNSDTVTINGLTVGETYEYTVTLPAYVSKSGEFVCAENGQTIDGTLEKAQVNETIIDKPSLWSNFRGNDENNGITTALTPTSHDNAQLYWAVKAGHSYGTGAPSSPILVDGHLIYTTATTIVKMDTVSGEVIKTGNMVKTSAFNITPPTYANGMIFVALAGGTIQAFNADTLESLWVYHDASWGQPNCPITYSNGYIYTGFWNGEDKNANFVCINAFDEDPSKREEEKVATWTLKHKGGFYWAGAYACDEFVVVGSDDGIESKLDGNGSLYVLDPKTGTILDKSNNFVGDIRSTICFDKESGKFYFTSKGGYFYGVSISKVGKIGDIVYTQVGGQSTSTPTIYNGRAYIGVRGDEAFGVNSGHGIAVVELETMNLAYTMRTRGYPQTSGVLTSGYDDGYVYVYFIDNYEPGKLRVLKDKPGQNEPIIIRQSDYEDDDDVNVLFTPKGQQANYAICSPIVDEFGTMYFKNDSSYMMALGSKLLRIEVTQLPTKVQYKEGETFEPAGIQVRAYYANGLNRDITEYVTYNKSVLSADDTDVEVCFPYASYNDELKNYEKFDKLFDVVDIQVNQNTDMDSAKAVENMINSLPQDITLNDKAAIIEVRNAFDELSYAAMDKVSNIAKLEEAEKIYDDQLSAALTKNSSTIKMTLSSGYPVINWSKNSYATSYNIYSYNKSRDKYLKVGSTQNCSFSLKSIASGSSIRVKVEPVAKGLGSGNIYGTAKSFSYYIKSTYVSSASASRRSYNSVKVSWKPVAMAKGYNIYMSTKKTSGFKLQKTVTGINSTSVNIYSLSTGKTYYFKVKAFAIDGSSKVYSYYSSVRSAKPTLSKPGISVKKTKKVKTIKISKISGATGYYIYRSTSKTKNFKRIGKTKKLVYYDRSTSRTKIYYKVKAYRVVKGKNVYSYYSTVK